MSLNGAIQVGRTALLASQAALQVAGNNMANAATEGFHRRTISLSPMRSESVGRGHLIGQGVQISGIRREVDTALQARFRDAVGDESAAQMEHRFLAAIETLQNELTDNDLSSLLSDFFNSFSEVANNPSDRAIRAVVIQQGQSLAGRVGDLRQDYTDLVGQIDGQIAAIVEVANGLLDQIEEVNLQIAQSENGVGEASALRDRRDQFVDELAKHFDISVIDHASGSIDILVNSIPVLLAGQSRGIEMRTQSVNGAKELTIRVAQDGTKLNVKSGSIGGLLRQRSPDGQVPVMDALDELAGQLIFQVNRLHTQGQGQRGFTDVTGTYAVKDETANLNAAAADLAFDIDNGSFFMHVTHRQTGIKTSYRIDVDGNAMSMNDLINEINVAVGVPNVTAGLSVKKELTLTADAGYEISFEDDSSGALAALGINTFFTGETARTIGVNQILLDDPSMLAVGLGHVPGSNGTALALANLQDTPVDALGSASLRSYWQESVNDLAVQTSAADADAQSANLVRDGLSSQIQAVSGVSLDEEAINLLMFQRQFQAAARFISVIDETLQILIGLA